ncbi:MAG: alpha/beta fold hydrolase [Ignavibacteriales bacterium]|nr:MAG: alpha/beta fold hydrolase [Ignavibacteriales bacterium]
MDTNKFFIIAIDALGNGISTSSSNYSGIFPQITIRDMVNSQYKFLTEIFGLKHVYGAVGGSMGGMQVLEWAAAYPGYIDKIVSYSGTPKMSSYDLLWMNTLLEVIQNLKEEGVSEKEIVKIKNMMIAMVGRTPDYVNEKINVDDFQSYLYSLEKDPSDVFTLDDFVIQFKAIMDHDISKEFNNSYKELAGEIKSDMFIIVSETDMMVNPAESIKLIDAMGCRKLILNNNCGHLAPSCEIERVKEEINQFLKEE